MADRPSDGKQAGHVVPDWGPSAPTKVVVSPEPLGSVRPAPVEPEDGFPISKVVS